MLDWKDTFIEYFHYGVDSGRHNKKNNSRLFRKYQFSHVTKHQQKYIFTYVYMCGSIYMLCILR